MPPHGRPSQPLSTTRTLKPNTHHRRTLEHLSNFLAVAIATSTCNRSDAVAPTSTDPPHPQIHIYRSAWCRPHIYRSTCCLVHLPNPLASASTAPASTQQRHCCDADSSFATAVTGWRRGARREERRERKRSEERRWGEGEAGDGGGVWERGEKWNDMN